MSVHLELKIVPTSAQIVLVPSSAAVDLATDYRQMGKRAQANLPNLESTVFSLFSFCRHSDINFLFVIKNGFHKLVYNKICLFINSYSLTDVDECQVSNGGCAVTCQNTEGSFSCSCAAGLELGHDQRSCRGQE